ncbi:hypothetical protein RN607_14295 [Demequina capsici]|uniref:Uncharacterized protein n=1 Tax=Demequina capsici TaxID=3075620 RepID=A0AA96FFB2_9MICO|nr:hypothetical protein [Demequina sp. PMTSA13]WNM27350.1 hypothetical protein RN607_14295 [Demequina sp. PMTSA13]
MTDTDDTDQRRTIRLTIELPDGATNLIEDGDAVHSQLSDDEVAELRANPVKHAALQTALAEADAGDVSSADEVRAALEARSTSERH